MNGPISNRENPARITYPMRRAGQRGEGLWERISWDDAFEQIAERLGEIKAAHGPLSIAGAVSNHAQSRGVAMRLLLRSLGSPNFMINQDLCHGCRATAALLTGLGGVGAETGSELKKSRVILVVGKSPSESHVADWMHIKAAKANGAKLIVVDPRKTQISRIADHWLAINTGTDAALALSMAHVIFSEGLLDREFVEQWCTGTEEFRQRAAQYPPDTAAQLTGIPAETIIATARLFATVKPGAMVLGHGVDAQANGVNTAIAFQSLLALTGNVDREGTNRLGKRLPGFQDNFINHPDFSLPREIEKKTIGAGMYPLWSGPNSWSQSCHNPAVLRAVHSNDPYPIRAMYVSGTNIVCTYPDQQSTVAALNKLDLLVVASDQLTPTAELADFFLPKTTLLEEEDVFTEAGGPCLSLTQRILPPLGEAKTDIEIAIGLRDVLRKRGLIDFEVMPWTSHREFIDYMLKDTKISLDDLRAKAFHEIPYGYEDYRKNGFKTPSKKFEFSSRRLKEAGNDPLPDYQPPVYAKPTEEFDLVLQTGIRTMAYQHSRFRETAWARRVQDAPELRIHPETATRFNIGKNDWVWVQTAKHMRRCLLKAHLTDEVPENTVATGMGWWYPEMSGPDRGASVFNIGVAVPYGPTYDPVSGAAEARNTACKVVRAEPSEVDELLQEVRQAKGAR